MSGLTSGLNPDLVKTELDQLFFSKFNAAPGPQFGTTRDEGLFRQDSTNNSGVNSAVINDGGQWTARANEQSDIDEASIISGQKLFRAVTNFAQSIPVPKHFMDDEDWSAVRNSISKQAKKGRLTDEVQGFALYRNGFTTATTNAGVAWFSNSHTNLNGDTVDNLLTGVLDPDSLNDAIVLLAEQKDQAGDIVGHEAKTLLVPPQLYKKAVEITESKLLADSADNNVSVVSSKYGIRVKQSHRIGAAAGGSDVEWFLTSDDHMATRWNRQEAITAFTPWELTKNFTSFFKAEFRNVYGIISYEGAVGSNGTT